MVALGKRHVQSGMEIRKGGKRGKMAGRKGIVSQIVLDNEKNQSINQSVRGTLGGIGGGLRPK